jgi:4-deoxy-L-threo-5-hexosulose-uronate ketol-isomerase
MSAIEIEVRHAVHFEEAERMSTAALRRHFLVEDLFRPGRAKLVYTHYDRMALLGVMPAEKPMSLGPEMGKFLRTDHFLARREMSVVNLGGPGVVRADKSAYEMEREDVLYLPMGTNPVEFESLDAGRPARFYGASAPAHAAYKARLIRAGDVPPVELGSQTGSNRRIRIDSVVSLTVDACQVMMGSTRLLNGNVWNSIPPHVHDRRMEAYLYFDLAPDEVLFHIMGRPEETRHLIVRDGQAILSPPWSIHCGCGTSNYAFIWTMAGDNQVFSDMDPAPVADLR